MRLAYISLRVVFVLSLLTGGLYPLMVTVVAGTMWPHQANGSLITRNGQVIGSELLGQRFTSARYFWGRPSATSPEPYNSVLGAASNAAATNPALVHDVGQRTKELLAAHGGRVPIPVELVTASASGLDPDISVAAAEYQLTRVAKARGWNESAVRRLLQTETTFTLSGVFGTPRVNVLRLNLALDELRP